METRILSNQVICMECGDAPYSMTRNDFVTCSCETISVDGGTSYLRRVGDVSKCKDISIEWSTARYNTLAKKLEDHWGWDNIDIDASVDLYMENENLPDHFEAPLRKAAEWAKENRRNIFGLICAFARTERDGEFHLNERSRKTNPST